MEDPYFASPAWNSSFDDNDASTTLDTSIETVNDSITSNHCKVVDASHGDRFGFQNHQHKYPVSRSSPGAPLAKEYHNVGGYFDDIESFTSSVNPLKYENDVSPRTLHPTLPAQRTQSYHHQKGSSIDTAIPGDDQRLGSSEKRHGASTGDDRECASKTQNELITLKHSSPMLSPPSIQASDFASTRRNSRSHTCQGIPSHILLNGLESINEVKTGGLANQHVELQSENETLRSELENTRSRLSELEEHMSHLAVRFEQDTRKETLGKNAATLMGLPASSNPILNFPVPPFTTSGLIPTGPAHFIDTRGHGTPDTSSLTSMSMTPDPFSPFQRFHSTYHKTGVHGNDAGVNYLGHRHGNMGGHDLHLHGSVSMDKQSSESHFERSNRAAMQDLQMPVDLLVAKTMGPRSQDASIALQQQLKTSSPTRKAAIIEAMSSHVVRLSEDKHGNFLVQRAIGVDARVAWELKGHFVDLSLSQFGCHVVQRVLDEETLQATVVEELLSKRILDTLTCRNSIHVWQKVLEINWADRKMREKIFSVINTVMKGRWAETAMQETGSIICQNIFESADGPEKEDCVTEILARLCECAANQWGVWVVQHIIEHGEGEHRRIAFDTLLSNAVNLTLSQYGQKAIMSALKSQDAAFINAYIDLLCDRDASGGSYTTSAEAPSTPGTGAIMTMTTNSRRSVLVDISSAPQGVQIITQLLTSVQPGQRDRIIKAVRKNSVFLKGSKAGLRVHQLCERARAFTGY